MPANDDEADLVRGQVKEDDHDLGEAGERPRIDIASMHEQIARPEASGDADALHKARMRLAALRASAARNTLDAIAKAVGRSRATVYQYFQSKEEIFVELFRHAGPAVLEHGRSLGSLGPNADGRRNLHQWPVGWAALYDKHAVVFLEFPGIGAIEGMPGINAGAVSDKYADIITSKLRGTGVAGIDLADASAALLRIAHMSTSTDSMPCLG
jgi:AcrR family transcriptional regulator